MPILVFCTLTTWTTRLLLLAEAARGRMNEVKSDLLGYQTGRPWHGRSTEAVAMVAHGMKIVTIRYERRCTSYTFYVQDDICKTKKRQRAPALKRPWPKPRKPIDSYGFPCPGVPWLLGRLMTYRHAIMVYINTYNVHDKRTRGNGYTPTQSRMHAGMRTSACHEDSSSMQWQRSAWMYISCYRICKARCSWRWSSVIRTIYLHFIIHLTCVWRVMTVKEDKKGTSWMHGR